MVASREVWLESFLESSWKLAWHDLVELQSDATPFQSKNLTSSVSISVSSSTLSLPFLKLSLVDFKSVSWIPAAALVGASVKDSPFGLRVELRPLVRPDLLFGFLDGFHRQCVGFKGGGTWFASI